MTISYCDIKNAETGILGKVSSKSFDIQNCSFLDCENESINILGQTPYPFGSQQRIKYCIIENSNYGISAANLSEIVIQQNTINGTDLSICLSNVSTPAIIGNILYGNNQMPGLFLESCNGVVRGNRINNHTHGISLGNSSPDIGGNSIEYNWNRGIYVGSGSLPNLIGRLVQEPIHPIIWYAVSGYNKINENGGWELDDDGSEIFINNANALLGTTRRDGCNQITDQRIPNAEDTPPLYHTQLLVNCMEFGVQIEVQARGNFWDEHPIYPLSDRFGGSCTIYYVPVKDQPCPLPDGSGGKFYITSSSGEIIDTLYAEEREIGELTETEQLYAKAEEKFLTASYDDAEIIYNQIISGNDSLAIKLDAYRRLYEIGKLTEKDENYFTGLRNSFLSFASTTNDSLLAKIFVQLSTLSLVANQEYVPAINEFDGIIQQNPNTEEAVYAEIDALTAALLVDGNDSTLQKGSLGKYLVKSSGDYNSKLDGLLRKHFGRNAEQSEEEILPTEYTLYQNYPNPFNPTTTIKYDLPNTSEVSLIIYDILGRKVKELVNTKQSAGKYEIQFSASELSSGVYIYRLIAENPSTNSGQGFMSSKKMILLK